MNRLTLFRLAFIAWVGVCVLGGLPAFAETETTAPGAGLPEATEGVQNAAPEAEAAVKTAEELAAPIEDFEVIQFLGFRPKPGPVSCVTDAPCQTDYDCRDTLPSGVIVFGACVECSATGGFVCACP